MEYLGYAVAGFVVALACTPAGVSGAFLLLPIQVLVFGAPSPTVSATNLLFNVTATPAGALALGRRGRLDRRLAALVCAGAVPGVVVGVLARSTALSSEERFAPVAAVVLVGLGARLLADLRSSAAATRTADDVAVARLVALGLAAGAVGGLYGIGGAALVVPWLTAVERLAVRAVAAAGLVVTMVSSIAGLVLFTVADGLDIGQAAAPDWPVGLALGAGGAVGAVGGAMLQPRVPVNALRAVLAVAALTAGARLLL